MKLRDAVYILQCINGNYYTAFTSKKISWKEKSQVTPPGLYNSAKPYFLYIKLSAPSFIHYILCEFFIAFNDIIKINNKLFCLDKQDRVLELFL